MTLNWPASVPTFIERGSFNETPTNGGVTFDPDYGPPMERKRVTITGSLVSLSMDMHTDDYERLEFFYNNEACGKSNSFLFLHPLKGVHYEYRFTGDTPISTSDSNKFMYTVVKMNWIQLPGGPFYQSLEELDASLWIDASDASFVTESAGVVSALLDKSGNSNTYSQSIVGDRPTTGNSTQNGLNFLELDGDQNLVGLVAVPLLSEFTLFAVMSVISPGQDTGGILGSFAGADEALTWLNPDTIKYVSDGGDLSQTSAPLNEFAVFAVSYVNGIATLYRSGVMIDAIITARTVTAEFPTIGKEKSSDIEEFSGSLGEFLVVPKPLSGSNIAAVTSLLNAKWGIE